MEQLQIRFPVNAGEDLQDFHYKGKHYKIQCWLSGPNQFPQVNQPHRHGQYLTLCEDGNEYAIFVYYYYSIGNGQHYAVVDHLRAL